MAERAFEPFFSTRAGAEGSGLGLSSVMDAVRRAGGTASIESEPERGTTVRLVLPEFREVPATEHRARGAQEGARGSILFVDDEPLEVKVVRNILERAGYEYLTAASAEEAEVLFEAHGQQVDLLVKDLKMPDRSGRELHEALRAKQPDLPAVFVSGQIPDAALGEPGGDGALVRFVQKPFRPAQLLEVIGAVLEATKTEVRF